MSRCPSRRDFLGHSSGLALAAGLGAAPARALGADEPVREIRRGGMRDRRLGRTDIQVSALASVALRGNTTVLRPQRWQKKGRRVGFGDPAIRRN